MNREVPPEIKERMVLIAETLNATYGEYLPEGHRIVVRTVPVVPPSGCDIDGNFIPADVTPSAEMRSVTADDVLAAVAGILGQ